MPAKELGCGSATTCCRRLDEWAKAGSKLHVAGDAGGLPLSVILSAANANHATVLEDIPRTGAWLGGFRRLRIRSERSSEQFYALAMLACSVICLNALRQPPW